jgi:hypothetical protein
MNAFCLNKIKAVQKKKNVLLSDHLIYVVFIYFYKKMLLDLWVEMCPIAGNRRDRDDSCNIIGYIRVRNSVNFFLIN